MVKNCPNCSATLDDDAAFCASCATPILQTIHCPKCDKAINADAKFCKYCAFDLSKPIQNPPIATVPLPVNQNPPSSNLPPQVEPIIQFQDNSSSEESKTVSDNPASLISPLGAVFAVICFFLPWLQMKGCNNQTRTLTGAELSGIYWLVPLMGIITIATYFICKRRKVLSKARWFIIGSSIVALCFFIYLFYAFYDLSKEKELEFQYKSGFFGSIIGFILAIAGCFFMSRPLIAINQKEDADKFKAL